MMPQPVSTLHQQVPVVKEINSFKPVSSHSDSYLANPFATRGSPSRVNGRSGGSTGWGMLGNRSVAGNSSVSNDGVSSNSQTYTPSIQSQMGPSTQNAPVQTSFGGSAAHMPAWVPSNVDKGLPATGNSQANSHRRKLTPTEDELNNCVRSMNISSLPDYLKPSTTGNITNGEYYGNIFSSSNGYRNPQTSHENGMAACEGMCAPGHLEDMRTTIYSNGTHRSRYTVPIMTANEPKGEVGTLNAYIQQPGQLYNGKAPNEKNNAPSDQFSTNGQIDPYIPEDKEKWSASGETKLSPPCRSSDMPLNGDTSNTTSPLTSSAYRASSERSAQNSFSISSVSEDIPTLEDFHELRRWLLEMKKRGEGWKARYEHVYYSAMKQIKNRDIEITQLKQQLQAIGIVPYSELKAPEDNHLEQELGMLFRGVGCWAKKYYKFPTHERIPKALQAKISETCEDRESERFLMGSDESKYLVVTAMALRFVNEELLDDSFLHVLGSRIEGPDTDIDQFLQSARLEDAGDLCIDRVRCEKLMSAAEELGRAASAAFLDLIQPLMSRPTDRAHYEQTRRTFEPLMCQASRLKVELATRHAGCCNVHLVFSHLGDIFDCSVMRATTGDNLAVTIPREAAVHVHHELCASRVRLAVLPHVIKSMMTESSGSQMVTIHKSYVIVL